MIRIPLTTHWLLHSTPTPPSETSAFSLPHAEELAALLGETSDSSEAKPAALPFRAPEGPCYLSRHLFPDFSSNCPGILYLSGLSGDVQVLADGVPQNAIHRTEDHLSVELDRIPEWLTLSFRQGSLSGAFLDVIPDFSLQVPRLTLNGEGSTLTCQIGISARREGNVQLRARAFHEGTLISASLMPLSFSAGEEKEVSIILGFPPLTPLKAGQTSVLPVLLLEMADRFSAGIPHSLIDRLAVPFGMHAEDPGEFFPLSREEAGLSVPELLALLSPLGISCVSFPCELPEQTLLSLARAGILVRLPCGQTALPNVFPSDC